jgi:translocation protein SEC63
VVLGEKKIDLTGKNCECSRCKDTIKKRQKAYKNSWVKPSFFLKLATAMFFWFLWYLTADQISNIKPMKSFDPYQILGVDVGAEQAVIKRAYRKLSLIKHPDKNPDDPLAVTEFI